MNRTARLALLTAPLVLAGCQRSDSGSVGAPDARGAESKANQSQKAPAPQGPDPQQVPAEAKTVAWDYYGLSNLKPVKMTRSMRSDKVTGTLETTLKSVMDGKATYIQAYSGGLSDIGSSEVTSDKAGIYTVSVYGQTLKSPELELPSNPTPGYTWKVHAAFQLPAGTKVEQDGTDKVVGVEQVKVGTKSYSALRVEERGTLKTDQTTATVYIKKWLVKGLGTVKLEIESKTGSGLASNLSLEAAE